MAENAGKYPHQETEAKWQERWERESPWHAKEKGTKTYLLIEFPYPSGDGLHTGHVRSYTALDIIARKRRAQGENVLYPIGWDAFGLPAENYAIKTGVHPAITTKQNVDNFRRQLKALGISFDWSREINTTDPAYYKWTQWIFLQLYKKGLAYKTKTLINWCPKDKVTLANEEVVDGACERCGTPVEKREKEQWMLAITKYAQRLFDDLDSVDYITPAKVGQRNWISPSEGARIKFSLEGSNVEIEVFTTRPDTIFGATYLVLAPEHPEIARLKDRLANWDEVAAYIAASKNKSDIERSAEGKEKTGVELKGVAATNPATKEAIPLYIADYVLASYGTGAIMAVPAHDERDYEFAEKYGIAVKSVIDPVIVVGSGSTLGESLSASLEGRQKIIEGADVYTGPGRLINSGRFTGMDSEDAKKKITEFVGGEWVTTYKLRDWVFGRQRYWGEPIPMINCPECGWQPVPEEELPVLLPETDTFLPGTDGESPLANLESWVATACPKCKGPARRETDTMPQWAGSSWYYLRYTDPRNDREFAAADKLSYWTPVDWYNGGMEHTTLHLLYSRFWHKFLFDIGAVPTPEPYKKRTSHGLILAEDGRKMSKSWGNVVSPDAYLGQYGADALRLYEMFIGPFDQPVSWSAQGVVGVRRFLERVWRLEPLDAPPSRALDVLVHQTVKKVTDDIEGLKMNTAVSSLMIFVNELEKETSAFAYRTLIQLLSPFAPHIAHELAERHGIDLSAWPSFDPSKLVAEIAAVAVQVNGKVRGTIELPAGASQEEALSLAKENPDIAKWLERKEPSRVVYVPGKILSLTLS